MIRMLGDMGFSKKGALTARLSPLVLGFLMTLYFHLFCSVRIIPGFISAFCVESAESLVLAKVLQNFFFISCS